MDTTRRPPRPSPTPRRDRPSRAPAFVAALFAVAALILVAVAPASATVSRTWRASVGARGANGTVTVVALTSGAGKVTLRLKSLPSSSMATITLRRGTCAKPGSVAASLGAMRTTPSGSISRSLSLARTAVTRLEGTRAAVAQVRASGRTRCGPLKIVASGSPSPSPVGGIEVDARNFAFSPGTITIAAGTPTVISFHNQDAGVPHGLNVGTSRYATPLVSSGVITGVAQTTFTIPGLANGTYMIWCPIHASMSATLIVGSGGSSATPSPTATTQTPMPTLPTPEPTPVHNP